MVDTVKFGFPVIIPGGYADLSSAQELDGAKTFTGINYFGSGASNTLVPSAGITSDAEDYASGIIRYGDLVITRLYFDLTGLIGSTTDLDIIGKDGVESNFGQITTAKNGIIRAGRVTCLEVPAGGADDVDFYAASVGTGAEDVGIASLSGTALITSGGAWTAALTKTLTAYPTANHYLYVCNGEGSAAGTFSAGKFFVELFGMAA